MASVSGKNSMMDPRCDGGAAPINARAVSASSGGTKETHAAHRKIVSKRCVRTSRRKPSAQRYRSRPPNNAVKKHTPIKIAAASAAALLGKLGLKYAVSLHAAVTASSTRYATAQRLGRNCP